MSSTSSPSISSGGKTPRPDWVVPAARFGYAAKALVYAVVGGLAIQQALRQGDVTGTSGALGEIASAPFGRILLGVVTVGLAAYVAWRLVQAIFDPEGGDGDDSEGMRWAKRAFYLGSAATYGLLTYTGASMVLGGGGGSGGSSDGAWASDLMGMTWGAFLVGAVGVGIVVRGIVQFVKVYTGSFRKRIQSFDLGGGTERLVLAISRIGLTARGVIFGLIGGSVVYAAITRDPDEARGLEGALEGLVTRPWLLAAVGVGLVSYAVYQVVKARYRLIGVN